MKLLTVVLFSAFCVNANAGLNNNAQTASCDPEKLNGQWQGTFTQKTSDVEFSIDLNANGNQMIGHSVEKDSRPNQAGTLEADWIGSVSGDTISLTKNYQLKGASPITYTANCNGDYQSIKGNWKVNFFSKGEFSITKVQEVAPQTQNLNKPELTNSVATAPEMPAGQLAMIDVNPTLNKAITVDSFDTYQNFFMVNKQKVILGKKGDDRFIWIPNPGYLIPIDKIPMSPAPWIFYRGVFTVDNKTFIMLYKTKQGCGLVPEFYVIDINLNIKKSPEFGECSPHPYDANDKDYFVLEYKHINDVDVYVYEHEVITKKTYPSYQYVSEMVRRNRAGAGSQQNRNNLSVDNQLLETPAVSNSSRYSPKLPTDYQSENTPVENANTAPIENSAISAEVKKKNTSLPPMPKKLKDFKKPTSQTHSLSF